MDCAWCVLYWIVLLWNVLWFVLEWSVCIHCVVMSPQLQFFAGPAHSGAPLHTHLDATNLVVYGEKVWWCVFLGMVCERCKVRWQVWCVIGS